MEWSRTGCGCGCRSVFSPRDVATRATYRSGLSVIPVRDLGAVDLARQRVARWHSLEVVAVPTLGQCDREPEEHRGRRVFPANRPLRQPQIDAAARGAPAARQERVPHRRRLLGPWR